MRDRFRPSWTPPRMRPMILRRRSLLALLVLACCAGLAGAPDSTTEGRGTPDRIHLVVLHTNDVHGQVLPRPATWLRDVDPLPDSGGLSRVAAAINRVRAEARPEGFELLVVDAGDWFQGTPEGRVEEGRPLVAALAEIGYDAMAVGNHEFDHGVDVLLGHLEAVEPPALLANVRTKAGELLPGTRSHIVVERGGLRIALVGMCSVFTPQMTHPSAKDLTWFEPAGVLAELRAELGDSVDLVLPLTHVGVGGDEDLVAEHPDLPLVVGGHSHSLLRKGIVRGETLIVQAGSKASVVGRVDLWIDRDTKRVVEKTATLIELYEDPPREFRNRAVDRACKDLVARSAARMDVVVGELAAPLPRGRDRYATSPSGNLVTDAMRAHTGADVAIQNRGGLRADLPAGPVTRRHLFQVLPFDNHVVTVTLTGAELEAILRRSVEGESSRGLEFSGAVVEFDRSAGTPRLARILVGGAPLDPAASYRLTTNNFTARGGDGYEALKDAAVREVDPTLLRDLVERVFADGPVTPPAGNRYRSLPQ